MFQTNRNVLWIGKSGSTPPVLTSEYVEIKMKADPNGKVYLPTSGTGIPGNSWGSRSYNRDVYIGYSDPINISGNASYLSCREVASGLTPGEFYYIKILPHNINPSTGLPSYGRAKALAMGGGAVGSGDVTRVNPCAKYLYEIVYEGGKMGYRESANSAGAGYKASQWTGTINLTYPYEEVDVSDITSVGWHYMACQYQNSGIITSTMESCPFLNGGSASTGFREQQYRACPNLLTAATEVDPEGGYYPHSYREGQYGKCTSLESSAPENPPSFVNGGFEYKYNQYKGCTKLKNISSVVYTGGWNSQFREGQFLNCGSPDNKITVHLYGTDVIRCDGPKSLGLADANVHRIYVPSNLLQAYKDSNDRSNIDDNKFFRN